MALSSGRIVVLVVLAVAYCLFPVLYIALTDLPSRKLETEPQVLAGTIVNESSHRIDIRLMVGDVFNPRRNSNDIRFDLAAVSCYFDPVRIGEEYVLPANPLLSSALYQASVNERERTKIVEGIVEALQRSSLTVNLIAEGLSRGSEGDQFIPHIWPVERGAVLSAQGVKYMAAMPLFDPYILSRRLSHQTVRSRLDDNTSLSVRRLLNYEIPSYQSSRSTIRTVGFAALGSTSSEDSPYFMSFKQGFIAIVRAVQQSNYIGPLDTVYLVGYERHSGVARREMIAALKSVWNRFRLKELFVARQSALAALLLIFLYTGVIAASYPHIRRIWKRDNRVALFGTLLSVAGLIGPAPVPIVRATVKDWWGVGSLPLFHALYGFGALILVIGALILTKRMRLFISDRTTNHDGNAA